MDENIVIAIDGNSYSRKECIKIADQYYVKNIHCVRIDGKWYRMNNPRIYKNSITNEYMKVTPKTRSGIYDYIDGVAFRGMFEYESEIDYLIYDSVDRLKDLVISRDVFDKIKKSEHRGTYYSYRYLAYNQLVPGNKQSAEYVYSFVREYDSIRLIKKFSSIDNKKYIPEPNNNRMDIGCLDKYSFGLEIETSSGIVFEDKCLELGLMPLRDGSISGHEYATVPMKGVDGLNLLKYQLDEIKNKCDINRDCSVHVHFGRFELNPDKIFRLHKLCRSIEDSVMGIFHKGIYNTSLYKSSGKDYCKRLNDYSSFNEMYEYLSCNEYSYDGNLYREHPYDHDRNAKWNVKTRYYWVNFINMLFFNKAKTIEFRCHQATRNYTKLSNWLFICAAILSYAESDKPIESKMSIEDILKSEYSKNNHILDCVMKYVKERREYSAYNEIAYKDNFGTIDMVEDDYLKYDVVV